LVKTRLEIFYWLLVSSRVAFLGEEVAEAADPHLDKIQFHGLLPRWSACKINHDFSCLPLTSG